MLILCDWVPLINFLFAVAIHRADTIMYDDRVAIKLQYDKVLNPKLLSQLDQTHA